jgi:hypothetical protein
MNLEHISENNVEYAFMTFLHEYHQDLAERIIIYTPNKTIDISEFYEVMSELNVEKYYGFNPTKWSHKTTMFLILKEPELFSLMRL